MANFKKTEKDPFEILDSDWKDAVNAESVDEIKKRVAKIALDQCDLMRAKKEDQDLAEKRELYVEAGAQYKEGTTANKKRIEYCRMIIENKGGK